MNITFLIGNGFDIGIGLKTRYEDFYKEYCVVKDRDSDNIKNFKKVLSERNKSNEKRIIDWADFEKAFGEYSSEFTAEEKGLYIECFEDFILCFNSYLEKEEKMVDYSSKDEIGKKMKEAVTTYFHIRAEDRDELQKIYDKYPSKRQYNFISFNYTKTIDKCVDILREHIKNEVERTTGSVAHIHGYIDANMIIGVNDASQITNPDFANDEDVISEIVKPQQNKEGRTGYENKTISLINKSQIICVYGMSIGETDKKWWDIISKWLRGNKDRRLVILKYDDKCDVRFIYTQRRATNNAINKFLSLSDLTEKEKDIIKGQIYVGVNYNVFSINLRKQEKKQEQSLFKTITPYSISSPIITSEDVLNNDYLLYTK